MHVGQLPLLFTAALLCSLALAEETQHGTPAEDVLPVRSAAPAAPAVASDSLVAQLGQLQRLLAESERQRNELSTQLEAASGERENAQLSRLRQENQRLKLQLKEARAAAPARLLSDQQTWFAVGAGAGLLGVLVGALLRGNRRTRREWIN